MVEKRPIIYYQNLMQHYDREVTALMQAKTGYILLSHEEDRGDQTNLNVASSKLTPSRASQEPAESAAPVVTSVLWPHKEKSAKGRDVAKHNQPRHRAQADKAAGISGLGLSLDQIFGEEEAVANRDASEYFKD